MFPTSLLLASLIVAMTGRVSAAATPVDDSSLVAELITSNTQVNRVKDVGVSAQLRVATGNHKLTPFVPSE